MIYDLITRCVCCDGANIKPLLDLREQPLANNLINHTAAYPLKTNLCVDCWHVQLSVAVDPNELFAEYLYVSGTSNTLMDHFKWFASMATEYTQASNVLEIACNDGSQLDAFKDLGLDTYGVDPAQNLYALSSKNHKVICDFFDDSACARLEKESFDLIVAQNVVAHTADPHAMLNAAAGMMHDDSLMMIQTSQSNMILNNEFDTIYHEHISFFSLHSMVRLASRSNLHVIDAFKSPIHGTSWIFVLSKQRRNHHRIKNALDLESSQGLTNMITYERYVENCKSIQRDLKEKINQLRNDGMMLIGYGAAAKGITLLNSIDESLDVIIDDNPLKQGLRCPGNNTKILGNDLLRQIDTSSVVFIPLAWNFFNEIQQRIKAVRSDDSDRFLRYFPRVEVI